MATVSLLRFTPLPSPRTLARAPPPPAMKLRHAAGKFSTRGGGAATAMSYQGPTPATERLFSSLAYALPFFNSLHYGRFLFARFPPMALAIEPLLPLLAAYRAVPYASFVAFFALYLGVVRNPSFSRYVRFNAMQAVVLDVFLALPTLFQRILGTPSGGIGFQILEWGYNGIFVFAVASFLYGVAACVLGKTPYLPIVASAADRQL
ncbi:chloroplast import component Tic20-II [Wolffia australiana]